MTLPVRTVVTYLVLLLSLLTLLLFRDVKVVVAVCAVSAVFAQARLSFEWMTKVRHGWVFRRALRTVVFFTPLPFIGLPSFSAGALACGVAVIAAGVPLLLERNDTAIRLDPVVRSLLPEVTRTRRALDIAHAVLAAPSQEYLYRWCILGTLAPSLGRAAIVVAGVLFVAEHMQHVAFSPAQWRNSDYAWQAYVSIVTGILAYNGQWIAAVLHHTLFNGPAIIEAALQPIQRLHATRKERFS